MCISFVIRFSSFGHAAAVVLSFFRQEGQNFCGKKSSSKSRESTGATVTVCGKINVKISTLNEIIRYVVNDILDCNESADKCLPTNPLCCEDDCRYCLTRIFFRKFIRLGRIPQRTQKENIFVVEARY